MSNEVLRLENIIQTYGAGTSNEIRALDNINLTVRKGDFLIIIGENGSGKTSFINAIYSKLHIDGKIFLNSMDISNAPEHKRAKSISLVTQNVREGTVGEFTVLENIVLASLKQRKAGYKPSIQDSLRKKYEKQLKSLSVSLESRLDSNTDQLSGGERQLICVLMAVIGCPSILLCDEATASIDVARCNLIENLIKDFSQKEGIPVLWITHDPKQVMRLGNQLIVFRQGKIEKQFDVNEKKQLKYEEIAALIHGK